LITKRGFAKVNKQRLPITDNAMIERELGEHGIVCTEGACLWHDVHHRDECSSVMVRSFGHIDVGVHGTGDLATADRRH
jgi:hypothetical protein